MILNDYIKLYIKLGWIVVLEGQGADGKFKKPIGKWKHFNLDGAVKPTFEDIEMQQKEHPGEVKGIGAISGKNSGFVILDLDTYKKDYDGKDLEKILEGIKTPISRTGGGGLHYFFKYNPNIKTGANLAVGIDTRGAGGNVVLPPSMHDSGGTYSWVVSPAECELIEMPDQLIEFLAKKPAREINNTTTNSPLFDFSKEYHQGERDEIMTRGAMSIVKIFPKHRWERDAWSVYKAWCESHIVDNADGYVNDEIMRVKFNSAMLTQSGENIAPLTVEDLLNDQNVLDAIFRKDRVRGIPTGFDKFDKKTGGILSGVLTVVTAQTGVGKSLVLMNFLDNIVKDRKVAYLDLENGISETLERILRIRNGLTKDFYVDENNKSKIKKMINKGFNNYSYYSVEQGIRDPYVLFEVMNNLVNSGVEVIVIDPLQKINGGDDFKIQGKLIGALSDFAKKFSVAILLCHHVRKPTNAGGKYVKGMEDIKEVTYLDPSIEDVKGGSIITDTAEVVWALTRSFAGETLLDKSKTILKILKCRGKGDALGKYKFSLDMNTLQLRESESDLSFIFGDNSIFTNTMY